MLHLVSIKAQKLPESFFGFVDSRCLRHGNRTALMLPRTWMRFQHTFIHPEVEPSFLDLSLASLAARDEHAMHTLLAHMVATKYNSSTSLLVM